MDNFEQTVASEQVASLNLARTQFAAQSSENYIEAGYDSTAALSAAKAQAGLYVFQLHHNPDYPAGGAVDLQNHPPLYGFMRLPASRLSNYLGATQSQQNQIYLAMQQAQRYALANDLNELDIMINEIDSIAP